jgi:hypothetical protein
MEGYIIAALVLYIFHLWSEMSADTQYIHELHQRIREMNDE